MSTALSNAPILAAVIQAFGVAAAATIGVALWWLKERSEKRAERERRDGKVDDYVRAIRADLKVDIEPLQQQFDEARRALLQEKLIRRAKEPPPVPAPAVARLDGETANSKDMPQAPVAPRSFVFEFVKTDLAILPEPIIEPVVAYYKLDQNLTGVIEAFAKGQFEGLSDERQIEAINAYFDLGRRTLAAAEAAQAACDRYLASRGPSHRGDNGTNHGSSSTTKRNIA